MTNAEFVQTTSRLEKYFDKEYRSEQLKEMFYAVQDWSLERYTKTVNYCIRNNKFLPKIADLLNAEVSNINTSTTQEITVVPCKKCHGSGLIKYFKKIEDGPRTLTYEFIALCNCENGKQQREINGYKFRTIDELGLRV